MVHRLLGSKAHHRGNSGSTAVTWMEFQSRVSVSVQTAEAVRTYDHLESLGDSE